MKLRAFFVVFFVFLVAQISYAAPEIPEIVDLQKDKAVQVEAVRDSNFYRFKDELLPRESVAWGLMIGRNEILTAAHAVWNAKSIEVITSDGEKFSAEIANLDADLDKAVIRLTQGQLPLSVMFRTTPLTPGEKIYGVDLSWQIKPGVVRSVTRMNNDFIKNGVNVSLIFLDIEGQKGMSGGPIFDSRGQVAGIVVRINNKTNQLTVLPIDEVLKRLK